MISALLAGLAVWCAVPAPPTARARTLFAAAERSRPPDPAVIAALLTPVAGFVVLGWPVGVVGGLAAAPVVHRLVGRLETAASRRRAARVAAQLPTALDLVAAALAVGRPPMTSFALAADATSAPLGPDLAVLAGRLAVASDPQAVWTSVATDPALRPVGRAFRRAEVSGMPVADILSGLADELRRDRRAQRRARSRQVSVSTAAPLGACFLPAFFLIGIVPSIVGTFGQIGW